MPTTLLDGTPFKHSLSPKELGEALAMVKEARTSTHKLVKAHAKAVKSGNEPLQQELLEKLIYAPEPILASAIAANKKLKPSKRQTLDRCLAMPSLLDFSEPLSETVPVRAQPKKSGGVRMLHNPGLMHRTSQQLVLRVMGMRYRPRAFQFTHIGVQAAIAKMKKAIMSEHVHIARLDIKDFYVSFDPVELAPELPLPKEVVEHAVTGRHMKVVLDQSVKQKLHAPLSLPTHEHLLQVARLGIPQGSSCSPIIGMFCMSRLAWSSWKGVVLVNYADDFCLLAKSPKLLDKAIAELTDAVANLPGGHFQLKLLQVGHIDKGVEFLGHCLRRVDGDLITSASTSNVQGLYKKLNDLDMAIGKAAYPPGKFNPTAGWRFLAEMIVFTNGWKAAFSECDDLDRYLPAYSEAIAKWTGTLGVKPEQLITKYDESMLYEPDVYTLGK
jgi:hypothetical protein